MTLFTRNPIGLQQLEVSSSACGGLVKLLQTWVEQHPGAVLVTEQSLLPESERLVAAHSQEEAQYEDADSDGLGRGSQFNLDRLAVAAALEKEQAQIDRNQLGQTSGFALLLSDGFCLLMQRGVTGSAANSGLERLANCTPIQADVGLKDALAHDPSRQQREESVSQPVAISSSQLGLAFDSDLIEAFVRELLSQSLIDHHRRSLTQWLSQPHEVNRPELQSHFTLLLLQQLTVAESPPKQQAPLEAVNPEAIHIHGEHQHDAGALVKTDSALPILSDLELAPASSALRIQELTRELQEAWETAHAAEQAKTEFLAMMSHELRTPLTCVIGMSATMLRWSFGDLSDRQRDYLQSIYDSGEHLLQLIESILDFSQAESGQAKLQMRHFSLRRLVSYCVQLFQELADQSDLQLRTFFTLTPEEDEFVADPQRLRQILINLLDNAIKFTPAGGQVSLRVASQRDGVLFQVIDTGIGIEPLQQSLLFQKFQQLDKTHQRRYEGSGLGLALTKHQVDLHQGTIELESFPGQGSTFNVWLPAQRIPAPISADKPQGTVVLLEDDDQSAALICELLTASGFKVVWLVESSTALEQILELQPLAAIVDLEIQGGSGDEIIRHIHQASFERRPKVLALASLRGEEVESFPMPEDPIFQADAYLFRPIQPEAFVARLQSLVAGTV